jgi:hypothetical protein
VSREEGKSQVWCAIPLTSAECARQIYSFCGLKVEYTSEIQRRERNREELLRGQDGVDVIQETIGINWKTKYYKLPHELR